MHRMRFVIAAVVVVAASAPALAQRDFDAIEIKVTRVAGKVYMLEGAGGNIGVSAGDDGLLMIDDQFAPLAPKIKAALRDIAEGELKFVINTHWHGDHTGGNEVFGAEATIIAHHNVRRRLAGDPKMGDRVARDKPKQALPVVTYPDELHVHFNGETIRVVHFPHGHTDGDSVVFFPQSNVVHMGDDFFAGRYPFVDLGAGGDVQGLADNIAKILAMLPKDVKVIPGHGPLSGRADLELYHEMLVASLQLVKRARAAGKSAAEIEQTGMPERWNGWGDGFISTDRWLQTVYDSLAR